VAQILDRLDDRFRLLDGGGRGAPARQRSLRATLEWSHALLDGAEQTLFARLSVFTGGFTLEGAQHVGADAGDPGDEGRAPAAVLDRLTHLVDASLVVAEAQPDGAVRFRLLETLRQFGQEQLAAGGAAVAAAVRDRHHDHLLALVRSLGLGRAPPLRGRGWPELIPEEDNLRAALEWSLGASPAAGLELATAAAYHWRARGRYEEGIRWLETFLERAPADGPPGATPPPERRAWALLRLGGMARESGHLERARAPLAESLALFRQTGDDEGAAIALQNLGLVSRVDGRPQEARARLEEALVLHRRAGRVAGESTMRRELGLLWFALGDLGQARTEFEAAVALERAADAPGPLPVLVRLGVIARIEGDLPRARRLLAEALTELRRGDGRGDPGYLAAALGDLALAEGRPAAARAHYRRIVADARAHGFVPAWRLGLIGLGLLALRAGDPGRATRLLGAVTPSDVTTLRMHVPYAVAPLEAALAACRAVLGDDAFDRIRREARAAPADDQAAAALNDRPPARRPPGGRGARPATGGTGPAPALTQGSVSR
jgi:predicted ATPase